MVMRYDGRLTAAVTRLGGDPADTPRRSGLVASQILGLALTRYILRLPPVVDMAADDLTAWVAPTIQRYLTHPPPDAPRRGVDAGSRTRRGGLSR